MTRLRRDFLRDCATAAGAPAILGSLGPAWSQTAETAGGRTIVIDPTPLFDISPHLYMQFMEPLGTTDPSVEGAWDYGADDWREDFVSVVKDLAPDCLRWGGIYAYYYKWREGVGPVESRRPSRNYVWGGNESNRVGTHEFLGLCRRTGAEPLICVNFLSDGKKEFQRTPDDRNRRGDAREAADWVSYANDPDNRERKSHGIPQPYGVKLWQIGNETSYGRSGFTKDESIAHTIEFSKAMRERDPSIQIIGWGDWCSRQSPEFWANDLVGRAGEHIHYVAFHMSNQTPDDPNASIRSWKYQQAPEQAWYELDAVCEKVEPRLLQVERAIRERRSPVRIAITEGHLGLMHNLSPLLEEWLTGVYHARVMNIYQRHGDLVRIATGADFEGNRWTSNAVMIPGGASYLMPVASVMRLFKRVNGSHAVAVRSAPSDLDIAASRRGRRIFLHVANKSYHSAVEAAFVVAGFVPVRGQVHEIAPEDPRAYVDMDHRDIFAPKEHPIPAARVLTWRFPARSVSAVELECGAG